jgi:hypothetical protein
MNKTVKKKVNFMNSYLNEGLSPSCIALSVDRFGSILCHSIGFYRLFYSFYTLFSDFQLFWHEYHWRDLVSRNAHLVHQNWYRISFHFHSLVLSVDHHTSRITYHSCGPLTLVLSVDHRTSAHHVIGVWRAWLYSAFGRNPTYIK